MNNNLNVILNITYFKDIDGALLFFYDLYVRSVTCVGYVH